MIMLYFQGLETIFGFRFVSGRLWFGGERLI
jgi:hypothetical protein